MTANIFVAKIEMNKQDLIDRLALVEHREGGYFAETYRSTAIIPTERQGVDRNLITWKNSVSLEALSLQSREEKRLVRF
jgi:hypothetical protein